MTVTSAGPIRFGSVSMVTLTLGANDPEVGTTVREGDEEYIFVYNNGNSQISKGQLAVCTAVTGYSVTVSSITHIDVPIGVCKHATMATSTYGWLLRKGFGPMQAGSAVAAGDMLTVGADGVWQSKLLTTAYSQVVMPAVFGKCMVAAASSAVGDAYYSIS
jgi:hypothetical protein